MTAKGIGPWVEIITEGDQRTARIVPDTFVSPVGDLWSDVWSEAAELMELEGATVEDAETWFHGLGLKMVIERENDGWIARAFEGEHPGTEVYRYGPVRQRMHAADGAAQTYMQRLPPSTEL